MLELHHVVRRFGDLTAVSEVSFTVEPGSMTGFVGANGAGKTTTMRMIMGVLAVTSGKITWNGSPVTATDRRRFGYMPEERGLYPKQTVASQLVYLGQLRGLAAPAAHKAVGDILDRLNLSERAEDKLESLSLGNQQRVQIAASLIGDPELLILDEPFSGLDPHAVDNMVDLLRTYARKGVPVLFSSHQLDLVERLCDRLVILTGGRVVADGTADELRRRGRTRYRLATSTPTEWLRGLDGVTVTQEHGEETVMEISEETVAEKVLSEAVARGPVREFARIVPTVADVFKEVTA
ncbi:ABC transporter ATP-binding protein [Streptomyces sp. URMC 123]|uniref:ABC transporter ATP-binding protein n=1 Tax=Streptomyces sp. URMC 123 TaxID=3423403 RepID=UPI003F1B0462